MTKIIIDTDLGDDADDSAAIIMALNSPDLEILGITTTLHNTRKRAAMVKDLLSRYGRSDIPVYMGYGRPLIERIAYDESPIQYAVLPKGIDFEGAEGDAVDFIIKTVKANPEVTIVEMGPMTNLGLAFYKSPQIMKQARVIAMGGYLAGGGVEWNIKCDPEAARMVMDYADCLSLFGLDITRRLSASVEFLDEICTKGNENMAYWRKGAQIYCDATNRGVILHDAILMAYLADPSVASMQQSDFTVSLSDGVARGSIVFKTNLYEAEPKSTRDFYYAKDVDLVRFFEIVKRLLR